MQRRRARFPRRSSRSAFFFRKRRTEARKRRELEKDRASFLNSTNEKNRGVRAGTRGGRGAHSRPQALHRGVASEAPAGTQPLRHKGVSFADVRGAARGEEGSRGRGKRRPLGYWRRRRRRGASARTRARRTPPRHATLPHLGAMLRRRARRGERGGKVWEAQATKVGLGLFVSLRRRACTRLCLCSSKPPSVRR